MAIQIQLIGYNNATCVIIAVKQMKTLRLRKVKGFVHSSPVNGCGTQISFFCIIVWCSMC